MDRTLGIRRAPLRVVLGPARPPAREGWRLVGPRGEVASLVRVAVTPWERMRGLLGRSLGSGEAFLLAPCTQVHTIGMRFAIDVVFCDQDLTVLAVETLPPGRVSRLVRRARCAIELAQGTAAAAGIVPGVRLSFAGPPTAARA